MRTRISMLKNMFILVLFMIALRPLIDLGGLYGNPLIRIYGQINPGAIYGVIFLGWVFALGTVTLKKNKALNQYVLLAFIGFGCLILLGLVHLLIEPTEPVLRGQLRFWVGFSPLWIVPYFYQLEPSERKNLFKKIFYCFLIAASVPVVIAWFQFVGIYEGPYGLYPVNRPTGGYYHPANLSRVLVFISLLSYIFKNSNEIGWKTHYLILLNTVLFSLVIKFRTGFLVVLLIVIIGEMIQHYSAILSFSKGLIKRKVIGVIFTFVIALPLILSVLGSVQSELFNNIVGQGTQMVETVRVQSDRIQFDGGVVLEDSFFRGRGGIWKKSIHRIQQRDLLSWLMGEGKIAGDPHNDILRIIESVGLLGFFFYVTVFIALFLRIWGRVRTKGRSFLGLLFGVFFLHMIPFHPTSYPNFMWYFFLILLTIHAVFEKPTRKPVDVR